MTFTSARVPFGVATLLRLRGSRRGHPGRGSHASERATGSPHAVARRALMARFGHRALVGAKRLLKRL